MPEVAVIREQECIGCARCLEACPVDAIWGASGYLHAVITEECIACELCVPICPVDCISMEVSSEVLTKEKRLKLAKQAKERIVAKQAREFKQNHLLKSAGDNKQQEIKRILAHLNLKHATKEST